jgi:hypothetical protein
MSIKLASRAFTKQVIIQYVKIIVLRYPVRFDQNLVFQESASSQQNFIVNLSIEAEHWLNIAFSS